MPVVHLIRKVLGTILAIACFGLALYALVRLVQGGSCGSGGNYVSTRPCPPGTGWWAFELPVGIVGGLFFIILANMKFGRARQEMNANSRRASSLRSQMFTAGSQPPAGWPAQLPWPPNDGPAAFQPPATPPADQDPLTRLERLRALRDANALTPAEYDAAKAKILSQM
jgi:hypothetical protein